MSQDAEFMQLIDDLRQHADPSVRAKAARALGQYVDELDDDEYEQAKSALDKAMLDPDPQVLMAAMQSMPLFTRQGSFMDIEGDDMDDMLPQKAASCSVCGRPEMTIPQGGCERDDCPYANGG